MNVPRPLAPTEPGAPPPITRTYVAVLLVEALVLVLLWLLQQTYA